jgi:hypothetical protein
MTDEIEDYAENYDNQFRVRPRLRSLVSRGSKAIKTRVWDEELGDWRIVVKMSRDKFDDQAKGVFLEEYAKWGRIGEAASAAGVTTQTVRAALEKDPDFAEAMILQEEEYKEKLIGHHQNLIFNGIEKKRYDKDGNVIETTYDYPIRLIELELKKHDKGYRDKQELEVNHKGGVLVAPAEMSSIEDWESRFSKAKDVTPDDDEEDDGTPPLLG